MYSKEGNTYLLKENDNCQSEEMLEVAVCCLIVDGDLLKGICRATLLAHGNPDKVLIQMNKVAENFKSAGLNDFVPQLVLMEGRFDIKDLNNLLNSNNAATFCENIHAQEFKTETLKN